MRRRYMELPMALTVSSGGSARMDRNVDVEPLTHVAALDGIRALAVLAVLAYHDNIAGAGGGFLGVSVFFTLSGFLITSLLVRERIRKGAVDLRHFWSRRFRRLLPAAWMTLALVLCMGALGIWDADQMRGLRGDVFWSIAELANWHFISIGANYGSGFTAPSPLLHFWSLAVEEQFYLVLPVLVVSVLAVQVLHRGRAPDRVDLRPVAAVVASLVVLSALANAVISRSSVDRAYLGTGTRAAELLVGALLAVVTTRHLRLGPGPVRKSASFAGICSLGGLIWLFHVATVQAEWLYPWGLLLTAGFTAAVIFGGAQSGMLSRSLSIAPLVALGRISYGVYLLHWPVFLWLTHARTGLGAASLLALRVGITLLAAAAMFRFVEQPIRSGRLLKSRTAAVVAPVAIVSLLAANLVITSGLPPPPRYLESRADDPVVVHEVRPRAPRAVPPNTVAPPSTVLTASTVAPAGAAAPSTTVAIHRATRVLLVGDSIAASIEDALGNALAQRGISYATAAAPGCGVIRGFPTDEQGRVSEMTAPCDHGVPERQLQGLRSADPDLVVSMSSWEITNRELGGAWYRFGTPEADSMLLQLLEETVDRLGSGGAMVTFVLMPDMVDGAVQSVDPVEVGRNRHLNALLARLAASDPTRVTTLALDRIVCPTDPCPPVVDGLTLRGHDGRHFDDPTAQRWVSEQLADEILGVKLTRR